MKTFEYKIISLKGETAEQGTEILTQLGKEGWDLVWVTSMVEVFLKREMSLAETITNIVNKTEVVDATALAESVSRAINRGAR